MTPLGPETPRDESPETKELKSALHDVCSSLYSTGESVQSSRYVSVLDRPPLSYTSERAYYPDPTPGSDKTMAAWIVRDRIERSTALWTEEVRLREASSEERPKGVMGLVARIVEAAQNKSPYESVPGTFAEKRFVANDPYDYAIKADLHAIPHDEAILYVEDIKQTIDLVRQAEAERLAQFK